MTEKNKTKQKNKKTKNKKTKNKKTKNPAVTLRTEILLDWLFNLIGEWWLALPFFHFSIVTLKHPFEFLQVESLKAR